MGWPQNVLIIARLHCYKSVHYSPRNIRLGLPPCELVGSGNETKGRSGNETREGLGMRLREGLGTRLREGLGTRLDQRNEAIKFIPTVLPVKYVKYF